MDNFDDDLAPIVVSDKGMKNDTLSSNKPSNPNPPSQASQPFNSNLGKPNPPSQASQPFNSNFGKPNPSPQAPQPFPGSSPSVLQNKPSGPFAAPNSVVLGQQPSPNPNQFGSNNPALGNSNKFPGPQAANNANPPSLINPKPAQAGFPPNASSSSNAPMFGNNPKPPQNTGMNFGNNPNINRPGNQLPGPNNALFAGAQSKAPAAQSGLDSVLRNSGVMQKPGNEVKNVVAQDPFKSVKPAAEQVKFGSQPPVNKNPEPAQIKPSNEVFSPGINKESSPDRKNNAEEYVSDAPGSQPKPNENVLKVASPPKSNQQGGFNNFSALNQSGGMNPNMPNPLSKAPVNAFGQPSGLNPNVPNPNNVFGQPAGLNPNMPNPPLSKAPVNAFGQPSGLNPNIPNSSNSKPPGNAFGQPNVLSSSIPNPSNSKPPGNVFGQPSGLSPNIPNSSISNPPENPSGQHNVSNPSIPQSNPPDHKPGSSPIKLSNQSIPQNIPQSIPQNIPQNNPQNFPQNNPSEIQKLKPPPSLLNNKIQDPSNPKNPPNHLASSLIAPQNNPAENKDKFADPKFNYVQSSLILDKANPNLVAKKPTVIKLDNNIPKDNIPQSFKKINEDEISHQYARVIDTLLTLVNYNQVMRDHSDLTAFFESRKTKFNDSEKVLMHFTKQLRCQECGNSDISLLLELNCTHILCRSCLEKQANSAIQRKIFQCPSCRKELNDREESLVWSFLGLSKAQKKKMQLESKYKEEKQLKCKRCKKFKKKFYSQCYHICKECFADVLRWKIAPCVKCHDSVPYDSICNETFECSNCSSTRYFVGSYGKYFKDENFLFCLDCSYDFFNEGENARHQIRLSKLERLELNDHIFAPCDGCKEEVFKGALVMLDCQHKLCEKCRNKPNCGGCSQAR